MFPQSGKQIGFMTFTLGSLTRGIFTVTQTSEASQVCVCVNWWQIQKPAAQFVLEQMDEHTSGLQAFTAEMQTWFIIAMILMGTRLLFGLPAYVTHVSYKIIKSYFTETVNSLTTTHTQKTDEPLR